MDIYLRRIEARRATVYLQVTSDREVHAYAIVRGGRWIDNVAPAYDGPSWDEGQAAANRLLRAYR